MVTATGSFDHTIRTAEFEPARFGVASAQVPDGKPGARGRYQLLCTRRGGQCQRRMGCSHIKTCCGSGVKVAVDEVSGEFTRRGPAPLAAVALSAVWPGLGHFGHRNRRAAVLTLGTLGTAAVGVAYIATRRGTTLVAWGVTPLWLWSVIAAAVCILALRIGVAVDAYRTAARRSPPRCPCVTHRLLSLLTLASLAVIITAPHVLVVGYAMTQIDVLSTVFDATDTRTATATPLPVTTLPPPPTSDPQTTVAAPVTIPPPVTTLPPPPTPVAQTTVAAPVTTPVPVTTPPTTAPPATASVTTAPPPTWDGADRLTIALLGSDAGFDRRGVRTDTIIVLSIDVAGGDAAAFNVPRNWHYVTFPEGTPAAEQWPDGYPGIVNEIYGLGLRFPEAFPNGDDTAGHAIKSALAQLTGLDIQYYVLIGMVGFVEVIDLFGGIDVHVTESINDRIKPIVPDGPHIDIVVEPGDYHFDGLAALGYVRSRTKSTDWHRMTRQRCVIEALIDQVPSMEIVRNYVALADIITDHINTDIPRDRLDELIDLADRLDTSRIVTVNFIPPEFQPGDAPIARVREAVARALRRIPGEAKTYLDRSCGGPE